MFCLFFLTIGHTATCGWMPIALSLLSGLSPEISASIRLAAGMDLQSFLSHRYIYLGLTIMLGTMSTFLSVAVLMVLKKRYIPRSETIAANEERETAAINRKGNFVNSDHLIQTTYWPEKETQL